MDSEVSQVELETEKGEKQTQREIEKQKKWEREKLRERYSPRVHL